MSTLTDLCEAHAAASRRADASARIIARTLLDAAGAPVDLTTHLRIHEENLAAEAEARAAWMRARSVPTTDNVRLNRR